MNPYILSLLIMTDIQALQTLAGFFALTAIVGVFAIRAVMRFPFRRKVLKMEIERERDGRWICDVTNMPGVMCYGVTPIDAAQNALELAERVGKS